MKKRALLFSAEKYQPSKGLTMKDLPGGEYDVLAMKKRLLQIGFEVEVNRDAKMEDYSLALQEVTIGAPNDSIYIVYFTGHGGHYKGDNYIFPVDAGSLFDSSKDIRKAGINIAQLISFFQGKGRLILILDACRTQVPTFIGNYSEMTTAENVYIAYGTSFGETSVGLKKNISWFTEAICDEILSPDIDVDTMFTQVRQNIVAKHHVQIPASVNTLLENVYLHSTVKNDLLDKEIYDFVEKYADEYNDKFGYFRGEDMIFIDAAQYFDISFLDALWRYKKVNNKNAIGMGINVPILTESESKIISFLVQVKDNSSFFCDEYHMWYYNGRNIRMGEIPPLPLSMRPKLPEMGKEIELTFTPYKKDNDIYIETNIPDGCKIYIGDNTRNYTKEYVVINGRVTIEGASGISSIYIHDSNVFAPNDEVNKLLGEKNRNIVGDNVKHHPIYGNIINYTHHF